MRKKSLTVLVILICYQFTSAQTASDVLENGTHIKSAEKIFLQLDDGVLKFGSAKSLQDITAPPDFTKLEDSLIFLASKNEVNIYLTPPLNPLNYSCTTETKEITDPINEAAVSALGSIIDILKTTKSATPGPHGPTVQSNLEEIQVLLEKDQKDNINAIFNRLKDLPFIDEVITISDLKKIEESKFTIEKHFTKIDSLILDTKKLIEGYTYDKENGFTTKYIFNSILKDFSIIADEQKKRLENLQIAFKLTKKAQEKASTGGGIGLKWCLKLPSVPSKEGKIYLYTISIKESGYKLSDKKEIISIETKEILKRTIRVRKFQRFVPEVSVGTAYTFFKYNSYGTTSDSTGQQYVASPTENQVRNLNIATMVNFNYYIPNSPIHPLYQIGIGINCLFR